MCHWPMLNAVENRFGRLSVSRMRESAHTGIVESDIAVPGNDPGRLIRIGLEADV